MMSSSKNNIRRNVAVLIGGMAGGLYGLLSEWPAGWLHLIIMILGNGLVWGGVTYLTFIQLLPKRTRGTLLGAVIGVVLALVTSVVFPYESTGPYSGIAAIGRKIVAGAAGGALVGTAPRGALIGAGIGAIVSLILLGVYMMLVSLTSGYQYNFVLLFIIAAFLGSVVGIVPGAYLELNKRGRATTPHL
ncbi:MAG TPA: hypothetical protein VLG46_03930 [Anaerolineae bacterium]|nr:hypothetical protein [Anaerolineae bacterium]